MQSWHGFRGGRWRRDIDIRDFIQQNVTPYTGNASFLKGPSERTRQLWRICQQLLQEEYKRGGVYDIDPDTPITINSHKPGYIDRDLEIIVGLQTDYPLKRAIQVFRRAAHQHQGLRSLRLSIQSANGGFFAGVPAHPQRRGFLRLYPANAPGQKSGDNHRTA